jgi:hypothetical protein
MSYHRPVMLRDTLTWRFRVTAHVGLAAVLATMIVALAPLASASPPDQTWLAGIYDNGDFDDVVLLIASSVGLVAPGPMDCGAMFSSIVLAPSPDDGLGPRVSVALEQTRAPPLS